MKKKSAVYKNALLLTLFYLFICDSVWAGSDWIYSENYFAKRFYLHSFANYDYPLHWYNEMEFGQFEGSRFQLNVGSVSLNKLNTEIQYRFNAELNDRFMFRLHYLKLQKHELLTDHNDVLMSFDYKLSGRILLFIAGNADYDKSKVNAQVGIMLIDPEKAGTYLRISGEHSQFVYDFKNEWQGKTVQKPFRLNWTARKGSANRWCYTEGSWQRAFIRQYQPAADQSLIYHRFRDSYALIKLYQKFRQKWLLMLGLTFRDFLDQQKHTDFSYLYKRRLLLGEIRAEHEINSFILRPELRFIQHRSKAAGLENYSFQRHEIILALFTGYQFKEHRFEFGYLTTHLRAERDAEDPLSRRKQERKALFGWSYYFSQNTILRFTVNHVFTLHGFGGGNMQFLLNF